MACPSCGPAVFRCDSRGGDSFRQEFLQPILAIIKTYLKPDGVVYLAHDMRRKCLPRFLEMAQEDFDIAVGKQTMQTSRGEVAIIVNCLRRKNPIMIP